MMKQFIRKYIPKPVRNLRHLCYAWYGAIKYAHPSEEMIVIGVTGTSGKSSTIYFLRQLLESAGHVVGSLSTIDFYIAGTDTLNDKKMTMLGKLYTQKYLRDMVSAGCTVAIVETTSEGFVQHRHRFINYDMMVLTNLYPEHIESHGSFENYKAAKLGIFSYVAQSKRKHIGGQHQPKTAIVNADCAYANEFLNHPFDKGITFRTEASSETEHGGSESDTLVASTVSTDAQGISFSVNGMNFRAALYGEYNIGNILAAIAVARELRVSWEVIRAAVAQLQNAPGRVERISEADQFGFHVIVDYAFEPGAMKALYDVVHLLKAKKIIHVFGSTGGGRDVQRRFTVGEFVGTHADLCIITDEDPYDDDPRAIMEDVAQAVRKKGKELDENLFIIEDRRAAIKEAIQMAKKGDVVLVTGKGSEQKMCVAGDKMIDWDDRAEVRKALRQITDNK